MKVKDYKKGLRGILKELLTPNDVYTMMELKELTSSPHQNISYYLDTDGWHRLYDGNRWYYGSKQAITRLKEKTR